MRRVTLIEGDGIGPEVTAATVAVLSALDLALEWERMPAGQAAVDRGGDPLPAETLASIRRNGVALKGPLTTQVGEGFRSVNVAIRRELDLYANLRPVANWPGVRSRYEGIDLIIVRESTEDLYAGLERMAGPDTAECVKVITRAGSERIARFAFEHARRLGRRRVTAVHKANIMKLTDGLFLECCRLVAAGYPDLSYDERIVDNMCLQLVQRPEEYDVLVMANLYGDILSDLSAGLVGGLGVVPGANVGEHAAVFEPVHGSAPQLAGRGQANPMAMILSAAMMLDHLGLTEGARRVRAALRTVLEDGRSLTPDIGGQATGGEMAAAIAELVAVSGGGEDQTG